MADYALYQAADEIKGWEALQGKLEKTEKPARVTPMRRWTMIAAALLLLIGGTILWRMAGQEKPIRYATTNEQQKVDLPDGTTMILQPQTRLQIAAGFNKTARTVLLQEGQASFNVTSQPERPFTVDMDAATVRDIGTSFTITKNTDSINIMVSAGKVAVTSKASGEVRELSAGHSICLYTQVHLRFDNAPLSEVIAALQKQYGKKITLEDTTIARKRLTVHLDGETMEDAIKIICASLKLESSADSNGYILKSKWK
jgi:transmembrane sensor